MELGNMIFGNSRGEFPIARSAGYERLLCNLFEAIAPDLDEGSRSYGPEYENDVFHVFPYYWGDCDCGYSEREAEWEAANKHDPECYQTTLHRLRCEAGLEGPNGEWIEHKDHEMARTISECIYDAMCKDFDMPEMGCAVHCTCTYRERWQRFISENDHASHCLSIRPNFLHKPSGLSIMWYKYPLRDAYSNQKLSLGSFRKIINECIASIPQSHTDARMAELSKREKEWEEFAQKCAEAGILCPNCAHNALGVRNDLSAVTCWMVPDPDAPEFSGGTREPIPVNCKDFSPRETE